MCEKPRFDAYVWTQWGWLVRHHRNFSLGGNTQIGAGTIIDAYKGVAILEDVKIGFNVVILSYSSIDKREGPVVIKKGACVGSGAVLLGLSPFIWMVDRKGPEGSVMAS